MRLATSLLVLAACVDPMDGEPALADNGASCPIIDSCAPVTPPADADVTGVWVGPAEVWATDSAGNVGRRLEATKTWCWCAPAPGAPGLAAVWGSASDDVWFAGDAGRVLHFDGAVFVAHDPGTDADLAAVWGSGAADLYVVGGRGAIRRFDGAAWSVADVGAEHQLLGVWGASAEQVWVVGSLPVTTVDAHGGEWQGAEAEVFRLDPAAGSFVREASWREERGAAALRGIGGKSASDVWAVGDDTPAGAARAYAFSVHFDGAAWSLADNYAVLDNRQFTDVAIAPAGAVITSSRDSAVGFDGAAWSEADPDTAGLLSIDARGDRVWAVGLDGKILSL